MAELVRFGVSIEEELLVRFDAHITKKGYKNRSEAIRDLIRDNIVVEEWAGDEEVVGTITMVYDHHTRDLTAKLHHMEHSFPGAINSGLHVHLDHHNCLEVLVVRGRGSEVQQLADLLIGTRGVKHGKLTMTTTGKLIPTKSSHAHETDGHDDHGAGDHGHSHEHGGAEDTQAAEVQQQPHSS